MSKSESGRLGLDATELGPLVGGDVLGHQGVGGLDDGEGSGRGLEKQVRIQVHGQKQHRAQSEVGPSRAGRQVWLDPTHEASHGGKCHLMPVSSAGGGEYSTLPNHVGTNFRGDLFNYILGNTCTDAGFDCLGPGDSLLAPAGMAHSQNGVPKPAILF